MQGMSATTGKTIDGLAHLRQSITDILTTPVGSRVMRRDYGSDLFKLIDQPIHETTLLKLYAATVDALARWEPRIKITRVQPGNTALERGSLTLNIEAALQKPMDGLPIGTGIQLNNIPWGVSV